MSLSMFLDSIKSEETRKHHSIYLHKYFEFAGSDLENAESKIIQFISLYSLSRLESRGLHALLY